MFALVSLAAASIVDEHTAFDGVVQFDALQTTVPGIPAVPTAPVSTVRFTICLTNCGNGGVQSNVINAVSANSGVGNSGVVITCGSTCQNKAGRSLLQVNGNNADIVLTGATAAQAQVLQNNINAGNLISVGIAPTTTVSQATPQAPNSPAILATPLVPSNPASVTGLATCANAALARLDCLVGTSTSTPLQSCASTQASILVFNSALTTYCCPCTNGFQVVAVSTTVTRANLCAAAPAGFIGCPNNGRSKKGLLGLLGLLGLIPLLLCLLICCLCCLRRKRRGQAMLFSQTAVPAPIPAPLPVLHDHHMHAGPDFHVHP